MGKVNTLTLAERVTLGIGRMGNFMGKGSLLHHLMDVFLIGSKIGCEALTQTPVVSAPFKTKSSVQLWADSNWKCSGADGIRVRVSQPIDRGGFRPSRFLVDSGALGWFFWTPDYDPRGFFAPRASSRAAGLYFGVLKI